MVDMPTLAARLDHIVQAGFITSIKRAKRVRIQAEFFQQPSVVLDFAVAGYNKRFL